MLFNSLEFIIFFPIVVALYFVLPKRYRWLFLLGSSYYFYMAWNPKYIILILLSTFVDYFASIQMGKQPDKASKKKFLYLSLMLNLGLLFSFKYLGFVDANIRYLFDVIGLAYPVPPAWFDKILLPVGISFYTFQTLSYTIDVYKGVTKPEKHFGVFALYVAFWPQLVAGPIERSNQLLPQLRKSFNFDYDRVRSGLFRMMIGFFKKVVIADRIAYYSDFMYTHYEESSGWTILFGAYCFAIQVYCDFSGYSDIAIGASRVLGINLMENFRRPYFAKNLADFWTRWHISLSTWLTDYVFFYLGAYKARNLQVLFNVLFVLALCGLWHGANWPMILSFVIIGVFMAVRFLWQNNVIRNIRQSNTYQLMQKVPDAVHIFITFNLMVVAFLLFRVNGTVMELASQGIDVHWTEIAGQLYGKVLLLNEANYFSELMNVNGIVNFGFAIFFTLVLFATEAIVKDEPLENVVLAKGTMIRWSIYLFMLLSIMWFGEFGSRVFWYFQF
ncbi:MAG: MBOAT family protein [Bacteroidetes bacterium]|nr:MBOAT family protein [Bacteroidota bacterium]